MAKLSVVISAYNEEKNIKDCLESVRWVDEIILIDNTSTDKTVEIAKGYKATIYARPNNPMLNINKNFGFEKATGDWILSLDADERVTPELAKEINGTVKQCDHKTINGYYIPRKNIIFGKWIKHTGWYPDYQLRLFKKGNRFPGRHVHEMVKVEGEVGYLKEYLAHFHYQTIDQFLYKLSQIYVPNEVKNIVESGQKVVWTDAIRFPAEEFLSRFFAREGYKDGLHGLVLSLLMAFYWFVIFAEVWEKQGFWEVEDKNFLTKVEQEFRKTKKDLNYWFWESKIKQSSNPLEKLILKFKRRAWG